MTLIDQHLQIATMQCRPTQPCEISISVITSLPQIKQVPIILVNGLVRWRSGHHQVMLALIALIYKEIW